MNTDTFTTTDDTTAQSNALMTPPPLVSIHSTSSSMTISSQSILKSSLKSNKSSKIKCSTKKSVRFKNELYSCHLFKRDSIINSKRICIKLKPINPVNVESDDSYLNPLNIYDLLELPPTSAESNEIVTDEELAEITKNEQDEIDVYLSKLCSLSGAMDGSPGIPLEDLLDPELHSLYANYLNSVIEDTHIQISDVSSNLLDDKAKSVLFISSEQDTSIDQETPNDIRKRKTSEIQKEKDGKKRCTLKGKAKNVSSEIKHGVKMQTEYNQCEKSISQPKASVNECNNSAKRKSKRQGTNIKMSFNRKTKRNTACISASESTKSILEFESESTGGVEMNSKEEIIKKNEIDAANI